MPAIRIDALRVRSSFEDDALDLTVFLHAPCQIWRLAVEVSDGDEVVAEASSEKSSATFQFEIPIPNPKVWSPESPHLYNLRIRLYGSNILLDEVLSYCGLRSIELRDGSFRLNGVETYLRMVLDQGYWPDGYLAAPSDDALRNDVEWNKRFEFNGVRKHQKIEDPRWLYWCDRLGLLVWGEMPNAREWSSQAEEGLASEWRRAVERDFNHPCVVAWVPVNESMGFPESTKSHPAQSSFVERMVGITRQIDADRIVIDNDGWEHFDITDICAIHDYTPTATSMRERYQQTSQVEICRHTCGLATGHCLCWGRVIAVNQ